MIKYCNIANEETGACDVGIGNNIEFYKSIGMEERDVEISEIDNQWYLSDKCPHYTPEEKEEQERERVGNLQCTKRVFVLMVEQLGLDYFDQILPVINSNRQAKLEWELCVELQRKNPLIDQLATQFGITSKQLDDLFKFANGEITQEEFLGGNNE